jgi:hypothetical protein
MSTGRCRYQRILNIDNVAIGMVEPASGFIRLIPPFGQDGIFQEMQQMRRVGGNFKKFMSMIDRLFGSLGIQYPYFHRPQQDKVVRGFGVQIPRTHHGSLAVEKINPIATDPKTVNRTSIVVLSGRRNCEISDKKARQTRNGRSHPNNHNNKQQTTYVHRRTVRERWRFVPVLPRHEDFPKWQPFQWRLDLQREGSGAYVRA